MLLRCVILYELLILRVCQSVELQVNGEVVFELVTAGGAVGRARGGGRQVTAGPRDEDCTYQFPERQHVDALVNHLTNQLIKMYVKTGDTTFNKRAQEPALAKRFRVVSSGNNRLFDHAFNQMRGELHNLYELSSPVRSTGESCVRQSEARASWRRLLRRSQATLRRAAGAMLAGVAGGAGGSGGRAQPRAHLDLLLRQEMAAAHLDQLDMLCDTFQLCFSDLIQQDS